MHFCKFSHLALTLLVQKMFECCECVYCEELQELIFMITINFPSFNEKRKSTESKPSVKPSYDPPVAESSSIENYNDPVANNEPAPKRRKTNVNTNPKNRYILPKHAPKHIKESNSN